MTDQHRIEKQAVLALRKLAATWPDSLWLFAAGGSLHIMRLVDGARAVTPGGGADRDGEIAVIDIPCDGGDW